MLPDIAERWRVVPIDSDPKQIEMRDGTQYLQVTLGLRIEI